MGAKAGNIPDPKRHVCVYCAVTRIKILKNMLAGNRGLKMIPAIEQARLRNVALEGVIVVDPECEDEISLFDGVDGPKGTIVDVAGEFDDSDDDSSSYQ